MGAGIRAAQREPGETSAAPTRAGRPATLPPVAPPSRPRGRRVHSLSRAIAASFGTRDPRLDSVQIRLSPDLTHPDHPRHEKCYSP